MKKKHLIQDTKNGLKAVDFDCLKNKLVEILDQTQGFILVLDSNQLFSKVGGLNVLLITDFEVNSFQYYCTIV